MKLERTRDNVFSLTLTTQELSALIAAARMAVDAMRGDPRAPAEALTLLERILRDYEAAAARLHERGGRE